MQGSGFGVLGLRGVSRLDTGPSPVAVASRTSFQGLQREDLGTARRFEV